MEEASFTANRKINGATKPQAIAAAAFPDRSAGDPRNELMSSPSIDVSAIIVQGPPAERLVDPRERVAAMVVNFKTEEGAVFAAARFGPMSATMSDAILEEARKAPALASTGAETFLRDQCNLATRLVTMAGSAFVGMEVHDAEYSERMLQALVSGSGSKPASPAKTSKETEVTRQTATSFAEFSNRSGLNPVPEEHRITAQSDYRELNRGAKIQLAGQLGREKGSAAVWKLIDIIRSEDSAHGDARIAESAVLALGKRQRLRLEPGSRAVEVLLSSLISSPTLAVRSAAAQGLVKRDANSYPEASTTLLGIVRNEKEPLELRKNIINAFGGRLYVYRDILFQVAGDPFVHKAVRKEAILTLGKRDRDSERNIRLETLSERERDPEIIAVFSMAKATVPEAPHPRVYSARGGTGANRTGHR